ncbi:MAG: ribosome-dependent ATPase [Planctomycetota bacterium]|jgi:ribosome-dependent ATPase
MNGFLAIFLKEFAHIRRERSTIVFAFFLPALLLTIFGYAIDVTIEHIPTVVLNLDGRMESRDFIAALKNTETFEVVENVQDLKSFHAALESGRAKTGVLIPVEYSERLLRHEKAYVQVLIDGSDSQVATTALNTVNLLTIQMSLDRARAFGERLGQAPARTASGAADLPIEARTRLLYNPDLESSHFFVPGLVAIILQLVLLFLTSTAIVRERELGTLEQIFVTPVGRGGLLLGKLLPYALMAFVALLIVLTLMTTLFEVHINGSLPLLIILSCVFIITALGLGLLISTIARVQVQAMQFAFMIMLPSVLLSGFMFPRSEMPTIIYLVSFLLPVTYFIEILRGIIIRGAEFRALLPHIAGLLTCLVVVLSLSITRFRKQLD